MMNEVMYGIRRIACPVQCRLSDRYAIHSRRGMSSKKLVELDRKVDHIPNQMEEAVKDRRFSKPFSEKEPMFNLLAKSLRLSNRIGPPKSMGWTVDQLKYDNVRRWFLRKRKEMELERQAFLPERHETLGDEIAAAHFIVYRGGKVKFCGQSFWIVNEESKKKEYDEFLPKEFSPSVFVEAIDATGVKLYYEGLENFHSLKMLRWLSLSESPHIDDWCLDRISGEFRNTLEYLDISGCPLVTVNGLSCLYRFEKLTFLKVDEKSAASMEFQLACLMLEDARPGLTIEGVKYIELEGQSDLKVA